MKFKARIEIIMITLITALIVGSIVVGPAIADNSSDQNKPYIYPRNASGQTYGPAPFANSPEEEPDLISALGENGMEGYVLREELDGPQPNTPEEAVEYMRNLPEYRSINLYASDGITVIDKFKIGGSAVEYQEPILDNRLQVFVNGYNLNPKVSPFIDTIDRTQAYLMDVGQALNCERYDEILLTNETRKIIFEKQGIRVEMTTGQKDFMINGQTKTMDTTPVIREGRTFIPVQFLGEALDCNVEWDGVWNIVNITYNNFKEYYTIEQFQNEMKARNYNFEVQDVKLNFLPTTAKRMIIGNAVIDIYLFNNNKSMEIEARHIDSGGFSYNNGSRAIHVSWVSLPHFYKKGNIIVQYIGQDEKIMSDLKNILGEQFAGHPPAIVKKIGNE